MDGDEVVQLYIRHNYAGVTRPVKELKAFRRISVKAGESAEVEFEVTPQMLSMWGVPKDRGGRRSFPGSVGEWTVEPGSYTLMVGSSSADSDLQTLELLVK